MYSLSPKTCDKYKYIRDVVYLSKKEQGKFLDFKIYAFDRQNNPSTLAYFLDYFFELHQLQGLNFYHLFLHLNKHYLRFLKTQIPYRLELESDDKLFAEFNKDIFLKEYLKKQELLRKQALAQIIQDTFDLFPSWRHLLAIL